jgi:aryl-alcohol dehydrogenase-like predicted oxidoreductase
MQQQLNEDNLSKVENLRNWAKGRDHTVGELALAWLLSRPEVSTIIAGATRPEQVEANAKAAEWRLSASDLKEIDQAIGIEETGGRR